MFHVNRLPRQTIHIKCQILFSLKNMNKYFKASSAVVVISAIRILSHV